MLHGADLQAAGGGAPRAAGVNDVMKHLPGPWRAISDEQVLDRDGRIVCNVVTVPGLPAIQAQTAALIAAAPEMLALLTKIAALADIPTLWFVDFRNIRQRIEDAGK